jgi:hypothetical protein
VPAADIDRARELFQQAQFELHESTGEDLERFRNARLQDLGFEPVTDALEVFSTLPIQVLRKELEVAEPPPAPSPTAPPESPLVSDLVLRGVEPPHLLAAAVAAWTNAIAGPSATASPTSPTRSSWPRPDLASGRFADVPRAARSPPGCTFLESEGARSSRQVTGSSLTA